MKSLYYGDNLEILRKNIPSESIDLCYIDPPFNSKRNYNQIYNNIGKEDKAQAQAFIDTWTWDTLAKQGFQEIVANEKGYYSTQVVDLIRGLQLVIKEGSLLAYLVSMTFRIVEIHRVLKSTGSFYLHCDSTASHYLKLILDAVFLPSGGEYQNEIIWRYRRWTGEARRFLKMHDVIFFYTKSANNHTFNRLFTPYTEKSLKRKQNYHTRIKGDDVYETSVNPEGVAENDVWEIQLLNSQSKERLGYPTQKPEALLERIIMASSNEGDTILDAYCGCGTTVAVAERLKRNWIGIDITYQSIALILQRLEKQYGVEIKDTITINGIPRDIDSAKALAHKKDDRLRKEFEKWAVLTYSNNRAVINDKKGADKGIDGTAYFLSGMNETSKLVFQVKSGKVSRGDISKFNNDREREGAELGIFITLEPPTKPMLEEAIQTGFYTHPLMGRSYPRIQIVTIAEIIDENKRMDIPLSFEVLKKAQSVPTSKQESLLFTDDE
ncbi:MAG: DNA methyltransferase [bacterium]|nr:DNA methyltransferase [bacterium]